MALSCSAARTDSPDGLVSDDDLCPVLLADLGLDALELLLDDLLRLVGFPLLERLAHAGNDLKAFLDGSGGLLADLLGGLAEECTALRVAQDYPGNGTCRELVESAQNDNR